MIDRIYGVSRRDRKPLLDFIINGLERSGCSIVKASEPDRAPFQVTFETAAGERMGIVAYAFLANNRETRNRPKDEHRFQIKYGTNDGQLHELWQDPYALYTTLFMGINIEEEFCVGADPVLNSPTRFFISKEFKQEQVNEVLRRGWHAWEREQRSERHTQPQEVLVGARPENFLKYVLFEREARGEDQGHRQLLAERFGGTDLLSPAAPTAGLYNLPIVSAARLHDLEREFQLTQAEILDLIGAAPRLKMAVRGWVAERHLVEQLGRVPQIVECNQITGEGQPDVEVRLAGGKRILVECKNVLRQTDAAGHARLDFMRTRAAQGNPCSRYYDPSDFQVLAACLHAQLEEWNFKFRLTSEMTPHAKCPGKLANRVTVDAAWTDDPLKVLERAA